MNALDMVRFSIQGAQLEGEEPSARFWRIASGDRVALHYFPIPPDIQSDLRDRQTLYRFYEELATGAGLGVVEVGSIQLTDILAVRTIFRKPQQPFGIDFIGAITLPYQDLSYVVKVYCDETGVTGIREALLAHAFRKIEGPGFEKFNWRMIVESEEYDSQFPRHPLSRLRAIMKEAQTTIRLNSALRKHKQFRWSPIA
jgi:hypothetical protein